MLCRVHFQMGRANEELGHNEQAIDSCRRLLLLDPADPADINYRLAKLFQDQDPGTAKRYVLEALADAPRFRQGHRLLLKIISDTRSGSSSSESTPNNKDDLSETQEDAP